MDIKLKKSKKIKAVICRAIVCGLVFATIFCIISGYKALAEVAEGNEKAFLGDVHDLTAFQEYIGSVYNNGMITFAGVGDDKGYPLEEDGVENMKEEATLNFYDAIAQNQENLFYYVYDRNYKAEEGEYGNEVHTNFETPIFSEFDGHLILPEDMVLLFYQDGANHKLTSDSAIDLEHIKFPYMPNAEKAGDLQFVLAMKNTENMAEAGNIWQMSQQAEEYGRQLICLGCCIIFLLLSWIISLFYARALRQVKEGIAEKPAQILLEVKLLTILVLAIVLVKIASQYMAGGVWSVLGIFACGACVYPILMDLNIKISNGQFFSCCIPVFISRNMKEWTQGKSWRQKLGIYSGISGVGAGISCILTFVLACSMRVNENANLLMAVILFAFAGIILLGISIRYAVCFVREVEMITDKVSAIRNGSLNSPIESDKKTFLTESIEDLNELESGMEAAVELKSRADKMQVELITNVSHDLKTPLTSIINYVDLLSEENLSDAAADYVKALKDKAYKLKSMVQDVFEVSKASSGNLPIEKTVLDIGKLIRQTLADIDERIESSNLTFKVVIPEEPVYIEGDGEKLYRVFQNLFINAISYSLDYSRVHVILKVEGSKAIATVKNTSKTELEFNTEEIVERFVRADLSRTSEGSGLGLSIAKSFTEVCGGEFTIITDADMFTAILIFPIVEKVVE